MLLGNRNGSVKIIAVHHDQDVRQDPPCAGRHLTDVVPVPCHQEEVGPLPEVPVLSVGLDQGGKVLPLVGPGHGQDEGLGRVPQESTDGGDDALVRRGLVVGAAAVLWLPPRPPDLRSVVP